MKATDPHVTEVRSDAQNLASACDLLDNAARDTKNAVALMLLAEGRNKGSLKTAISGVTAANRLVASIGANARQAANLLLDLVGIFEPRTGTGPEEVTAAPVPQPPTPMVWPPHMQRVIDEKAELDERRKKLGEFIEHSEIFRALSPDEGSRLIRQASVMESYSTLLAERIDAAA